MSEPHLSRATSSFQEFFRSEAFGGALLVACAALAMLAANSPLAEAYGALWSTPIALSIGGHIFALDAHQWINDGLMAVFFLLVGLEIKREALAGELASPRQAALPIAGAVGGMLLPAVIYAVFSAGGPAIRGWAIPMATDIAFALGVLALVAPSAPAGLKIFLAALAIVDDMGAVLVIALFYSAEIVWGALGIAAGITLLLAVLNASGVRHLAPYLLLGVVLWFFFHESGIHATIAGVVLAFSIPARTRIDTAGFSARAHSLLDELDRSGTDDRLGFPSKERQEAIIGFERASEDATTPLLRLEHALHRFASVVVMPLFALSNAGVSLAGASVSGVTAAVMLGLVVGKPLGITLASMLAVRARLAALPDGVRWTALHAVSWLGGIGFTMSLFITSLSFDSMDMMNSAKIGILGGSLMAGIAGGVLLRATVRGPH